MLSSLLVAAALLAASTGPVTGEMTRVADAFDRAQLTKDARSRETMIDEKLIVIDGLGKRMAN